MDEWQTEHKMDLKQKALLLIHETAEMGYMFPLCFQETDISCSCVKGVNVV